MPPLTLPAGTHKVGLLAGWGRPVVIAEALAHQGYEVHTFGVKGHADPQLAQLSHKFTWGELAKLRRRDPLFPAATTCIHVTMAGKIHKFLLFQPWAWFKHLPDRRTIRILSPTFHDEKRPRGRHAAYRRSSTNSPATRITFGRPPIFSGVTREPGTTHQTRPHAGTRPRTSSSAGRWPRRWAASTSARASP